MTAALQAQKEIGQAAKRATEAERDLRLLADQMIEAGASPDLDCQEAIAAAAKRLRALSESLAA